MDVLTSLKSASPAAQRETLRQLYRTDLFALAHDVLYKDVATPMTVEFHKPVCLYRQRTAFKRNLYLLSRDHLKTSVLTVSGNVQRIIRDSQVRILLAGNKAETAESQLREIKGHLTNPLLLWLYPEILWADPDKQATETWTTSAISVKRKRRTKEATIETIGAEGAATGKHYDHASYDDLVDEHNSQTKEGCEKIIHWYVTTQSLLEPHATQEIVGTPWAFGDLYDWTVQQVLKRRIRMGVYRQPCWQTKHPGVLRVGQRGEILPDDFVVDAEGHKLPAYPQKHTREALEEREAIDPEVFAAQWLLRPVDSSSALFPRGKARIVRRLDIPPVETLWCVMCVDPAISTSNAADFSAIAVVGFATDGSSYLLDLRRGHWSETELIDQVYDAFQRTPGIQLIGFEAVGFQKLYFNLFRVAAESRGFLPLTKLERDTKISKRVRIRGLEPYWGVMAFAADCPALDDFLSEAERFRPWKDSIHDDMLDAVVDCLQLRVRPDKDAEPDGRDEEERDRAQFEEMQNLQRRLSGQQPLDRASMRASYAIHRRHKMAEEARERDSLGVGSAEEFYCG